MKKILLLVLSVLVLLVGCSNNENQENGVATSGEHNDESIMNTVSEIEKEPEYVQKYLEIIDVCEKRYSGENEITYDLIYFNDDDVPELVAGVNGYFVNLYTYASGDAYILMEEWSYGVMGNLGYEYLPRGNVLRNYNSDLAGSIRYVNYMTLVDGIELKDMDLSMSVWTFDDKNENYMIDEGEELSGDCYYYYGETKITEQEYVDRQIEGEFVYIYGSKTAEEMRNDLLDLKK